MKKTILLMILDGYGLRDEKSGNAIAAAKKPNLDRLTAEWPHTVLGASGLDVGLPDGQMGNSEVGHTNIGAGRVVYQELTRITKTVSDGSFYQNPVIAGAMDAVKDKGTLHLMGLLSDGGVHSHIDHLFALLEMAKQRGISRIAVHSFLDGRDTDPKSGAVYLSQLEARMKQLGVGFCATVSGRYYAMDRDKRWERVKEAYDAVACGMGEPFSDAAAAVRQSYRRGVTDEFIRPMSAIDYTGMAEGDAVIFYNFRPDRARELTRVLVDPDFNGFSVRQSRLSAYVCMTSYDKTMPNVSVAFLPQNLGNTLGQVLEAAGKTQLRIAETEKYAHVTFFFNGGVETPASHERRILVDSPKVATYDLLPEMSALTVTERLLADLEANPADFIVLNFANCDMVGHTGVFDAAVRAVETVDACTGRIVETILSMGGIALITADHGNADEMLNAGGKPMTAHSTNPVPFIAAGLHRKLRAGGVLSDIAPTVLELFEIAQPAEMTGQSLLL